MFVAVLAPYVMGPIKSVKPKDSRTLMAEFNLQTGATYYVIRIENTNGFFREDSVASSPAEIKNLSPYTEYSLRIMAANSVGRSQPSIPVTAKTGIVVCHVTTFIISSTAGKQNARKKKPPRSCSKHIFIEKPRGFSLEFPLPCRSQWIHTS